MEKEQTNENSWEFHLTDKIQPLETQNKSSNLLFFAFLVILFP